MSIREDSDDLLPDRHLQTPRDPEPIATATDHTKVRSGSFGLSMEEASQREDAILDKALGVWRPTTPDDVITKDTVRAFDIGGGILTDMTLAEAYKAGVLSEWDDHWGEAYDRPDFTPEELEALEREVKARQPRYAPKPEEQDMSEDTPLEAVNLIMEADLAGIPRNSMLDLADDIRIGADGRVELGDQAQAFLSEKFGMTQSASKVAQDVFNAWHQIAIETIGPDAVQSIGLAGRYNPEAAKDIQKIRKRALIGILTKKDLQTMKEKWA